MGLGDRENYHDVDEDGPFGRGRAETRRIARRTNERKDKMNGDKGTSPKDLSVTNKIMNVYGK